jgi:heat shock protein 90kDa beta
MQEINPRHPLIAKLNELVSFDAESKEAADLAWLMFDTAMAASGFTIEKIDDFSARMYRYVHSSLLCNKMTCTATSQVVCTA